MPRERVRASDKNGYADILVRWSKDGSADHTSESTIQGGNDTHVSIFVAPKELPGYGGGFYFHPDNPEQFNLDPGNSVGPIDIPLNRTQINRLIRTLRSARDQAYGADA